MGHFSLSMATTITNNQKELNVAETLRIRNSKKKKQQQQKTKNSTPKINLNPIISLSIKGHRNKSILISMPKFSETKTHNSITSDNLVMTLSSVALGAPTK